MRFIINFSRMSVAGVLLALAVVFAAPCARSETARPPANRFLFIYDISAPMHTHLAAVQKSTREIFESRCSGQLHYGDTLGVWSFDQELHTGFFPLETWTPGQEDETLLRVQEFLKQQHGGKSSQLDAVMDGVSQVITGPQITTVILYSTGARPMLGTPFNQEINDAYRRALNEMKHERMPLVTVLQARNGKLLKYTVNALPWPAVIPELPIPIKNLAATRSESSDSENAHPPEQVNAANNPSATAPSNAAPSAPLNRAPSPKTLVLNPPGAAPTAPANTPAQNPTPVNPVTSQPPQLSPPAPVPSLPPQTAATPTGPGPNFDAKPPMPNLPSPTPAVTPSTSATVQTPAAAQTATVNPPPAPAPVASSTPAPKPPAQPRPQPPNIKQAPPFSAMARSNPAPATSPTTVAHATTGSAAPTPPVQKPAPNVAVKSPTGSPPVQTAVAMPSSGTRSTARLVAGIAMLCVAMVLLYVTIRRFRGAGEPSLITRSMGGMRK